LKSSANQLKELDALRLFTVRSLFFATRSTKLGKFQFINRQKYEAKLHE